MSKPTKETRTEKYELCEEKLFEEIANLESSLVVKKFLGELLTPSEMLMVKRRWYIACLLLEGFNIRAVAKEANVSTQTVVSVKRALEKSEWFKNLAGSVLGKEFEKLAKTRYFFG